MDEVGFKENESIKKNNSGGNNNEGCGNGGGSYGGRHTNPPLDGGFVIYEYFWVWGNY